MLARRLPSGYAWAARVFNSRQAAIASLLALIGAVYANALGASFQFDDFNVIVDYAAVHSLRAWFDALPSIRPLLKFSYALNWALDAAPFGFHLFNLICHLGSALLVFRLCRQLLAANACGVNVNVGVNAVAWLAALLFALHPAQTEAVTYISGRSVALMGVFYLGALCALLDARTPVRNVAVPLLFIAALLSKETAWTLPGAALLIFYVRGAALRESLRCTRPLWLALLAGCVLIVATPAYRRMLQHVFSIRSPLQNIALQVEGWWYLLTRPLLLQTNIDPDLPQKVAFDVGWWLHAALLSLALIGAWRARSRWLRFALLWFFLHLLPTNSLLPRNDIANDRQLYLALIGPAVAIARALLAGRAHRLRPALALALLAVCAGATLQRNRDYRDEIALWEATARVSPHKARVWNNLGYAYQLAGRSAAAVAAYERALALDPGHERARINWRLLRAAAAPSHP